MNRIKIENLPARFTAFENVKGYEFVTPLILMDFDWCNQVIDKYPQPLLLRHYWENVVLLILDHMSAYQYFERECGKCFIRLADPRRNSLDWLIKRIDSIPAARKAFEKFIQPDTATGQMLLGYFNTWRSIDFLDGKDPLGEGGIAIQYNRFGMRINKEAKDEK